MSNEIKQKLGQVFDEMVSNYVLSFKDAHPANASDSYLLAIYMYSKGLHDGITALNYLDKEYFQEELLALTGEDI